MKFWGRLVSNRGPPSGESAWSQKVGVLYHLCSWARTYKAVMFQTGPEHCQAHGGARQTQLTIPAQDNDISSGDDET